MEEITLFRHEDEHIRISIEARWEGDVLVVEGYDIGKRVEEYWGDSDYEYSVRVMPPEVGKLFLALGLPADDRAALLQQLAKRFSTNTAYSEFRDFLDQQGIAHEGFSWA
jgi:hypothetical protein